MGTFTLRTTRFLVVPLLCLLAVSLHAQTAQFLWEDSTTQGNWTSSYGADGYNVINQVQQYPSYATVTAIGQSDYTWTSNTQDVRGLQVPGQTYRVASQWYSNTSFVIDINLTDGLTHEVALYCLDWDRNARAEVVSVLNQQTGAVLDSRTVNSYGNGRYLVWALSGHVQIQFAHMSGYNATVSGIFFSPAATPSILGLSQQAGSTGTSVTVFGVNFGSTGTLKFNGTTATPTQWTTNSITAPVPTAATSGPVVVTSGGKASNNNNTFTVLSGQALQFLGVNGYTQGTWEGVYGSDGYNVIPLTTSYPAYATVTPSGQGSYTWSANTPDVRGLQVPGQSYRMAAAWCDDNCAADGLPNSFTIGINLTDGGTHQIGVYCLDWDNQSRVETINILNPTTGAVLDSHTVSSFNNGQYLVWNVSGNIQIQVTNVSGPNAVISGLFFSPAGAAIPTIWGISQNVGQVGATVGVLGTNFGSSGSLNFNGTSATTQWTNSNITATVPNGATTGNIVVTAAGVATNGVPFTVTPTITSLAPTTGPLNTVVQINGSGFGASQGGNAFIFNGIAQTPGLWTSTQVTSELPSILPSGPVYVSVGGSIPAVFTLVGTGGIGGTVTNLANGQAISGAAISLYLNGILQSSTNSATNGSYSFSNLASGTYSLNFSAAGFSAAGIATVPVNAGGTTTENISLSTPQISVLSPASGPVGTVVVVTGSNFGALQGSSTVNFGSLGSTPTQWSNTSITVPVPAGAATSSVAVTVGGATSNLLTFTVGVGTIQGTVTAGGVGFSGATVSALQSGAVKASTTSSSTGTYSIGNLVPGSYDMEVVATGYGTQGVSGVGATAGNATTKNFTLSAPGTISGTVMQGTTAIVGATVTVYQGYTSIGSGTTDSTGTYTVGTLAPATYSVTAAIPGYDTLTKSGQAVTSGNTTTTNFTLVSTQTINYSYDGAGRVAGVVDSINSGVIYNYDAAGNILSIAKKSASLVSISSFAPVNGPVGTTVNIYGSGFSTTPNQNLVAFFNNVAATVTSATPTSLVVTVPAGVATGKIKVTVGSSSATSTTSFTVTSSNGLPSITNFTPAIATPGTTVTINGSNFDPTAGHDSLTVNINKTYAATATTTAITTTLPGVVTSGHVAVTTTAGSFTTPTYLFVPPPGYTAAQVGYTGQVALAGQVTAKLSTANQIGLVVLDVPAGVGLSIGTVSTFTSNVPYTIYDPYGNSIGSGSIGTGTSYIDTTKHVAVAGTCTVMIAPGNATGSVTLSPTAISSDIYAPITIGGAPVTIATTNPGQAAHLTFSGYAGQRLYLYVYNPTGAKDQFGNQGSNITMLDPNRIQLLSWSGGAPGSTWYGYSGLMTLGQSASTYTINFTPSGLSTWGATFQLGSVPADVSSTITVSTAGGTPAPVTIATQSIGQSAHLSFSASAGQRLYLYVYSPTGTTDKYNNSGSSITMLDTNGGQVLSWSGGAPGSTWYGYSGLITLSAQNGTGTYTINFTPRGLATWGATFQLVSIPADLTSPITVSPAAGPPAPVTIATQYAGQSAHLTFTGSANQRLLMWAYTPTGTKDQYGNQGANIWMYDPTGAQVLYWGGGAQGSTWYGYSGLITLQKSGTYTITFTATGLSTWGATFQLVTIPADVTSPITVAPAAGPPAPVTISTQYAGQSAHLTFTGSPNQRLFMWGYTPTGTEDQYGNSGANIWMYDPTGAQVLYWGGGAQGSTWYGYSGLVTLQKSGTYTITFTPTGLSTWGATFQLVTIPADVTSPINLNTPVTIATAYAGQSGHLTFNNTVSQTAYLYIYTPTGAKDQYNDQGANIWMYNPANGQVLYAGGGNPGSTWTYCSSALSLSSIGTYTITFTPSQLSLWGATFELMSTPCP